MAQYSTNFDSYGAGVNLLASDWSNGWATADLLETEGSTDIIVDYETGSDKAVYWNDAGTAADADVIFDVQVSGSSEEAGPVLRGSESAGLQNGYIAFLDEGSGLLRIGTYVDGAPSVLNSTSPATAPVTGEVWKVRFRADGTSLMAKAWLASGTQPSSWLVTTNDSQHTSGWIGFGSRVAIMTLVYGFYVGTNGDVPNPDLAGPNAAPVITIPTGQTAFEGLAYSIVAKIEDPENKLNAVQPGHLTVGGSPAAAVAPLTGDRFAFEFGAAPAVGTHTISCSASDEGGLNTTETGTLTVEAVSGLAYPDLILQRNPLAYYRLGEASGSTTVADATGTQGAGQVVGAVTLGAGGILPGDTAASFPDPGTEAYIELPVTFDPASGPWSLPISLYIPTQPSTDPVSYFYAQLGGATGTGKVWLQYNPASGEIETDLFSGVTTALAAPVFDAWAAYTLVCDGVDAFFYVGSEKQATLAGVTLQQATGYHLIGTSGVAI